MRTVTAFTLLLISLSAIGVACVSDPSPHPAADAGAGYPPTGADTDFTNGQTDELGGDGGSRCDDDTAADDGGNGGDGCVPQGDIVVDDVEVGPTDGAAEAGE